MRKEVEISGDAVLVKGFAFAGNTSVSSAEFDALHSNYVGQTCCRDKLRDAAINVTEKYHRHDICLDEGLRSREVDCKINSYF